MNASRVKTLIIGVLALALVGCSAVRLGYNNGSLLARWWVDDYFDLSGPQSDRLTAALDDWFGWHRATQLPDYADALAAIRAKVDGPIDPAQVCAWNDDWRQRLDRATDRALPAAARLLPEVTAAQWAHLAMAQAEKLSELQQKIAPADPDERRQAAWRRTLDRAETLYGSLDEPQRRVIQAALARSPFEPARWLAERRARHADLVRTGQALQADGVTPAQRIDGLRSLMQRTLQSPDPAYRAYAARGTAFNCQLMADLHNSTNARQRAHLRQRLSSWEEDLRALAAQSPALQTQ